MIIFISIPLVTTSKVTSTDPLSYINSSTQDAINMSAVESHIRNLTSWSRFTTYPGCEAAAAYIYNFFNQCGLSDLHYEPYTLTVPVDHGANITILSPTVGNITAFPLLPNEAQASSTPPEGIEGSLIYAGDGNLSDFNGQEVAGNIVLLEFNSDRNWMNAMRLGAKAVIFITPKSTDTNQAELKTIDIPIYMPRVLVSEGDGAYLKSLINTYGNGNVKIRLHSSMTYEVKTAKNIVGFIEGTDPNLKNEIVVLAAHFDSSSAAPSSAPGAQDACSAASLLELADYFSKNTPRRTLMFVALSGYYQSLAGSRYFTEEYFFNSTVYQNIGNRIKLFINLDMSTDGQYVGIYYTGFFYYLAAPWTAGFSPAARFQNLYSACNAIIANMLTSGVMNQSYLEVEKLLIRDKCSISSGWEATQPGPFWLDSEPVAEAGITAVSFRTAYSLRIYQKTPSDTFDTLAIGNLQPQLEFTFNVLSSLINRDTIAQLVKNLPSRSGGDNRASFGELVGQILLWNNSKGSYSNLTEAGVDMPFIVYLKNPGFFDQQVILFDHNFVVKTDEHGYFSIYGLVTPASGVSAAYSLEAYAINSSGSILYATDLGKYGAAAYSNSFSLSTGQLGSETNPRWFIVFKCGTMAVHDLSMPDTLNPQKLLSVEGVSLSYNVLKISDNSQPDSWGIVSSNVGEALLFVPDLPVMFTTSAGGSFPIAFLTNASLQHPEGVGYQVELGGFLNLNGTAQRFAADMYWYDEAKITQLHEFAIHNQQAEEYHNSTRIYMQEALNASREKRYDAFQTESLKAFGFEQSAYNTVHSVIMSVIQTTIFFFVALIPFSLLVERLVFKFKSGFRQALATIVVFALFTLILFFLHPGFHLAANVYMVLLGFVIVVLTIPVLLLVISDAFGYIRKFRVKAVGKHYTEINRLGAALMSFSTGVENMRKRRLRTTLTFMTVVIITIALVSFTSTSAFTVVRIPSHRGATPYNGILMERITGMGNLPLSEQLLDSITDKYGSEAYIAPRAWIFPSLIHSTETSLDLYNANLTSYTEISAIMGMAPEEVNVSDIANRILINGSRWFDQTDYQSCIISNFTAGVLHAKIGDVLIARGFDLKVVGIFDENKLSRLIELDGESITPVLAQRIHMPASLVMIVPFRLAGWNGEMGTSLINAASGVYQIAMKFENSSKILDTSNNTGAAINLAYQFTGLDIFAGRDGTIWELKRAGAFMVRGWTLLIIPVITAFFTLFNTMLGSVYEREKEISIYSALGLSPLDVAFMFLAESVTYAILAAVIGYTIGVAVLSLLVTFHAVAQGFYVNYSASYVLLTVGFAILAVVASTLYPARQAARLVTPSLERKWGLKTKPEGDEWTIPMPFTATEDEAKAVLVFMSEFLEAHRIERAGTFSSSGTTYEESETEETKIKSVKTMVSIAPWEAAIQQETRINVVKPPKEERWSFQLYLKRLSGHPKIWQTANRNFIDAIRKQLLIWRGLSPAEKKSYLEQASKLGTHEK